jgi:excisionase family DNA binding protein
MESELLTPKQAATMIGVDLSMITKLRKSGRLGFVKLGHRTIRIELSELHRFLNDSRIAARKLKDRYGAKPQAVNA